LICSIGNFTRCGEEDGMTPWRAIWLAALGCAIAGVAIGLLFGTVPTVARRPSLRWETALAAAAGLSASLLARPILRKMRPSPGKSLFGWAVARSGPTAVGAALLLTVAAVFYQPSKEWWALVLGFGLCTLGLWLALWNAGKLKRGRF